MVSNLKVTDNGDIDASLTLEDAHQRLRNRVKAIVSEGIHFSLTISYTPKEKCLL